VTEKPNIKILSAIVEGSNVYGEIKSKTGLADPTISRYLDKFLAIGLIKSKTHEKDKRKVIYELNPEELVITTLKDVIQAIRKELKEVGEDLTPEEEEIVRKILLEDIRPIIIADLKNKIPIFDEIEHVLNYFTSLIFHLQAIGEMNNIKLVDFIIEKWLKTKLAQRNPFLDLRFRFRLLLDPSEISRLIEGVQYNEFLKEKSTLLFDLLLKSDYIRVDGDKVVATQKLVEKAKSIFFRELLNNFRNLSLIGLSPEAILKWLLIHLKDDGIDVLKLLQNLKNEFEELKSIEENKNASE